MERKEKDFYIKNLVDQELFKIGQKSILGGNETTNADGGYLVSTDVAQTIVDNIFVESDYVSEPERFEVRTSNNKIKIPSSANLLMANASTGTRAYWTGEGIALTSSKLAFSSPTLTLQKITVLTYATNELIDDCSFISDKITEYLSKAAKVLVANDMLYGSNGILGIFGNANTLTTSFTATPTAAELIAAHLLLHPALVKGAKWYVTQAVYEALYNASYNLLDRTLGNFTCLGLPVEINSYLTGQSKNHIFLGNFKGYAIGYKSPKAEKSMNLNYLTDEEAFRLTMRMAGTITAPKLAYSDGTTRAAFITPA